MPAPSLPVDWDEIEKGAIAAIPYSVLAERYGIPANAIHQRAHRFKWAVPNRIKALAAEMQEKATNPTSLVGNVSDCKEGDKNVQIARLGAQELLQNGATSNLLASQIALALLQKASEKPDSIRPLETIADVKTSLSVARIAAGMDKEGTSVNMHVSLFGQDQGQAETGSVWEAETEQIGEKQP